VEEVRGPHLSPGADADPWLDRWLPLLREAAAEGPMLELGCDTGRDTATLRRAGLAVVATDLSAEALRQCERNAPGAMVLQHDLRQPLPFADARFGVVLASLCLHYFDWAGTVRVAGDIRRCLRPGGVLLCRLNSTADVLHGATGHEEIEPHYYRVHGHYAECKRFFDRADIGRLFAGGWRLEACEERTIHRYADPKVAWEAVLRRDD
jgi:SAM-dependent methyltransferase